MSKGIIVEFSKYLENDIFMCLTQNNIKKGKLELKLNISIEDFPRNINGNVLKNFKIETLNYSVLNDKKEIDVPKKPLTLIYKDIQATKLEEAIEITANWIKK